jgi:hypothetical protein
MLQSPAIFLQHAISDGVICVFGRQASAGIASQRASKLKTMMERQRAMTKCYPPPAHRCKGTRKELDSGTHFPKSMAEPSDQSLSSL